MSGTSGRRGRTAKEAQSGTLHTWNGGATAAELSQATGETADNWIADVNQQLQDQYEYLTNEDVEKAPTGIWGLDEVIDGGIRSGEVFGLMARSGVGKTIVLCNLAYQWGLRCRDRLQVMFSLEMPRAQITLRLSQIAYGINKQEIRDRTKYGLLDKTVYATTYANLFVVDKPSMSAEQMSECIRHIEAATGKRVGMVSIDYLGLVGGHRHLGRYERISEVAVDMKNLAKLHKAAVVVAIQVAREKGGDGSRRLDLSSSRDSGVIEEAVDYMGGLWKEDPHLRIGLFKNRHGPLAETPLYFDKSTLMLTDRM